MTFEIETRDGGEETVIVTKSPATLEVNDRVVEMTPENVERAVSDAAAAQREWAARSIEERVEVFERVRDLLLERKESIARNATEEVGKPFGEAMVYETGAALAAVEFVTEQGPDLLEEPIPLGSFSSAGTSTLVREPIGVVGVITPWNYPFAIPAFEVVPVLFAGNGVVMKPGEATPRSAFELRDLLYDAGVPEDLFAVVPGRGSVTGQALVESDIAHLSFTGSSEVGFELERACSERGISLARECGGSDPAIVLPDADLEFTASGVVSIRFLNAGQSCAAVKRLYVHESVEADLREKILERVENLRVGYGPDEVFEVGPLISEEALENVHSQVERSVEMGAEVLLGGEPMDREGHFYEPTVLTNVTQDMPVVTEETFGPVLPIMSYETVDEAVEKANDTRYGLSASVWTTDTERGEEVARRIEAGTVLVNDHCYTGALFETPWGGYGDTGGDFSHGRWAIEAVTRTKHVHVTPGEPSLRQGRFENPWWFPYDEDTADFMRRTLELMYSPNVTTRLRNAPSVMHEMFTKR